MSAPNRSGRPLVPVHILTPCCRASLHPALGSWDTSKITKFQKLFYHEAHQPTTDLLREFNGDISKWDTSKAVNMHGMFKSHTNNHMFNRDISKWDVSKVTNFEFMFEGAASFDQDLSKWVMSPVRHGPTRTHLLFLLHS